MTDHAETIAELTETNRLRDDLMRSRIAITNRIKAVERRLEGDVEAAFPVTIPLHLALEPILTEERKLARRLRKLAAELPAHSFTEQISGFGSVNFAQIVAETGDLWRYANPAKVWKRMGLAVIEGRAQRRVRGAEAFEHGFSPRRRAVMANVATSLMTKQNSYKALYDERKAVEQEKLPAGPPAHIDARARRYMVKRLLRDLWAHWRQTMPRPPDLEQESVVLAAAHVVESVGAP